MNILMISPRSLTARCGVSDYAAALLSHLRNSGINADHLSPDEHGVKDFIRRLRFFAPDIIHLQYHRDDFKKSHWPAVMSLLSGITTIPLITTFHDLPWPSREYGAGIAGFSDRLLLWFSAKVLFTNRYDLGEAARRYPVIGEKADLAPVGPGRECILPEAFDRRLVRRQLGFNDGEIILLYFGFLKPGKGVETLIESIRLLLKRGHRVKLLIVGDLHTEAGTGEMSYAESIRRSCEDETLTGQITVMGYLKPDEISAVLKAGDIGVLPFDEGLSSKRSSFFTLIQHGIPTVSTRGAKSRDTLVEAAAAFLVPSRDPSALASHLERMITDQTLIDRIMPRLAIYMRDHHSWPAIVQFQMVLYRNLLKKVSADGNIGINDRSLNELCRILPAGKGTVCDEGPGCRMRKA